MVNGTDKVIVEMQYCELFEIVGSLSMRAHKLIELGAPEALVSKTISRAEKFNAVLRQGEYDCWTQEHFEHLRQKMLDATNIEGKNSEAKDE